MKQYPLLNSKLSNILFVLFLTAMLFLSRDTLFSSCLMGFAKSQILMLGLMAVLGAVFLWVNRKQFLPILKDRRMLLILAASLILVLPMAVKRDWQLMYFSILFCVLTGVFLTYFTSCSDVAKIYVVLLVVLGIYSIFATYVLRKLAMAGVIQPAVFENSKGWKFFDFVFAYAVDLKYWNRNCGIFREPGVYQFFVLLAVYLNNYWVDWNRQWKAWFCNVALAFTMLTTFAIGGFAELGLFIVFVYFDKKWYREKWGKIAGITAVFALIGAVGLFFYKMYCTPYFEKTILYEFYDMFVRATTDSDSMVDRKDAIVTNLQLFFRNPLVGNAIANVLHGTNHNTSSTLLLFAILGLVGGTLNVAAWIALLWKQERKIIGNLILMLTMFMSFNTQNLTANVFFWLFPMMALVERGLPMLCKE